MEVISVWYVCLSNMGRFIRCASGRDKWLLEIKPGHQLRSLVSMGMGPLEAPCCHAFVDVVVAIE